MCVHVLYSVGRAVILSLSSISLRRVDRLPERRREESGVMLQRLSCRIMIQLNEGEREGGGREGGRGGQGKERHRGRQKKSRGTEV